MHQLEKNIKKYFYCILFPCLVLAGCSSTGGNSVRFYVVNPVDQTSAIDSTRARLKIEILDLHVPQYLERSHIATRIGENRLQFSEFNQWGENLRKNLMRTMARNLTSLLSTSDISTPFSRSSSIPDYRVEIHIDQFEMDSEGIVNLSARWQVIDAENDEPLGIQSTDLSSRYRVPDGNFDQMVGEMRDLYGELSRMIAESIITVEKEG